MKEFKGTKGKWLLDTYGGQGSVIDITVNINDEEDAQIAQVYSLNEMCYKEFQNEEHKANAKLIAAAPEMLEMLQKIKEINNAHNFNGHLINEQIEKLLNKILE